MQVIRRPPPSLSQQTPPVRCKGPGAAPHAGQSLTDHGQHSKGSKLLSLHVGAKCGQSTPVWGSCCVGAPQLGVWGLGRPHAAAWGQVVGVPGVTRGLGWLASGFSCCWNKRSPPCLCDADPGCGGTQEGPLHPLGPLPHGWPGVSWAAPAWRHVAMGS